jgi:hypothetical protein
VIDAIGDADPRQRARAGRTAPSTVADTIVPVGAVRPRVEKLLRTMFPFDAVANLCRLSGT